jgi:hypothetical protein
MFLTIIKEVFDLEEAVRNNDIIGILILIIIILSSLTVYFYKLNTKNEKENKKELVSLQTEMLNKEKQSEKELIDVLNGVSTILKMSEQADKFQTEKIIGSIKNLENRLIDKLNQLEK